MIKTKKARGIKTNNPSFPPSQQPEIHTSYLYYHFGLEFVLLLANGELGILGSASTFRGDVMVRPVDGSTIAIADRFMVLFGLFARKFPFIVACAATRFAAPDDSVALSVFAVPEDVLPFAST